MTYMTTLGVECTESFSAVATSIKVSTLTGTAKYRQGKGWTVEIVMSEAALQSPELENDHPVVYK